MSPPQAAGVVAEASGLSKRWNVIGVLGTIATFMIMSYYSVIAGWVLAYTWKTAGGWLVGLDREQVAGLWRGFLASPLEIGAWHIAFLGLVALISARGVNKGIEIANKIRAPALLVLLLILVAYSLATGDVQRGLSFAFAPNLAAITPQVVLAAIGQAFYATGVGMAMMIAYGAYVVPGTSLVRTSVIISGSILLVSLLATLMIFPLVFRYGMNPAQGVELVFDVLATVFAEMPGGRLIGSLFFLLLVFAALTPSLAGIEPLVAWLQQRRGLSRAQAAVVAVAACWVVGIGSVLSFNVWAGWRPLGAVPAFADMTFFSVIDYVSSNAAADRSILYQPVRRLAYQSHHRGRRAHRDEPVRPAYGSLVAALSLPGGNRRCVREHARLKPRLRPGCRVILTHHFLQSIDRQCADGVAASFAGSVLGEGSGSPRVFRVSEAIA